jgi:hypothetical protein
MEKKAEEKGKWLPFGVTELGRAFRKKKDKQFENWVEKVEKRKEMKIKKDDWL